ncbi:MAG TPA: hypothetical protein VHV26_13355 [Rhizomicrobium sp.]|jgi:hypothetical protein|nr:hypothetical protein [Rhizomicrobium sp.]
MAKDRSVRFLSALGGASTSRVFNLHRIAQENASEADYIQKPLFASAIINRSFVLKHRTRADESYMFARPRAVSTKIIIPFDDDDLKAGGYSMFVEQRGYVEMLRNAGHYNSDALDRDMAILKLINALPSLDPFLLREHLRNNDIEVAACYFAISEGDRDRMYRFAEQELSRLVVLAGGASGSGSSKLVTAMLSNQVDDKLEPLRVTLGLSGDDFHEGVFSWRGFLYYKWSMTDFWPDVMKTLRELNALQPVGAITPEQKAYLADARRNIIQMVRDNGEAVNRALGVYDHAFADLVANQSPKTFKDFLLAAPYMFLEMGEKLGAISHIVSFWRYRFPPGLRHAVDAEELAAIFNDFSNGFGERTSGSRSITKPAVIDRTGGGTPTIYEPVQIRRG